MLHNKPHLIESICELCKQSGIHLVIPNKHKESPCVAGGSSFVYCIEDTTGSRYALKISPIILPVRPIERLNRTRCFPHIFLESVIESYWISLESWIDHGDNLFDLDNLDIFDSAQIAAQLIGICEKLAREYRFYHGDLAPGNIIVSENHHGLDVTLIDCEPLVEVDSENMLEPCSDSGSILFMAPERLLCKSNLFYDKVLCYEVASILYFMMYRVPPYVEGIISDELTNTILRPRLDNPPSESMIARYYRLISSHIMSSPDLKLNKDSKSEVTSLLKHALELDPVKRMSIGTLCDRLNQLAFSSKY